MTKAFIPPIFRQGQPYVRHRIATDPDLGGEEAPRRGTGEKEYEILLRKSHRDRQVLAHSPGIFEA